MNQTTEVIKHVATQQEHAQYMGFLNQMHRQFEGFLGASSGRLFHARALPGVVDSLFDVYLRNVPEPVRQYHNCNCCRSFVNRFGGLVHIDNEGGIESVLWAPEHAPQELRPAVASLRNHVVSKNSVITGPLVTSEAWLGWNNTNGWDHMAVPVPKKYRHADRIRTAGQKAAELREEFKMLKMALVDFSSDAATQALNLLRSGTLSRPDAFLQQAEWFWSLHQRLASRSGRARDNLIWREVMAAPRGFTHVRSSAFGTLMEDIGKGLSAAEVKAKFDAMVSPTVYRRPTAAPTTGNIKRGEEIVAKLGLAPSFARRFARLDEVEKLWTPSQAANVSPEVAAGGAGLFDHLKPSKSALPMLAAAKSVKCTWDKFQRTVLPLAQAMQVWAPAAGSDNYCALVTATNADAPPILLWDHEDARNPVSWYRYHGGSAPAQWGLKPGSWVDVTAVCLKPCAWKGEAEKFTQWGGGGIFLLDGAKDSKAVSIALFPEFLKSDLREIRSTIAAFSNAGDFTGHADASACGVMVSPDLKAPVRVAVTVGKVVTVYDIDRID